MSGSTRIRPTETAGGGADRGTAPVIVDGDLDLLGAPPVRDALAARLQQGQASLVVDVSGCTFIDSVGLSLLLTARERCLALGGTFRLVGAGDEVRALLRTVGVLDLLIGPDG